MDSCESLVRRLAAPTAVVAALICALAAPVAGAATYVDPSFNEEQLVGDLDFPVQVAWAPDGRMFVAEKDGKVKVQSPGQEGTTTILDITEDVNGGNDRGLLSIAVDSQYPAEPYLYVLFTADLNHLVRDGEGPMVAKLRRYTLGSTSALSNPVDILGTYDAGPCPPPSNTLDCIPSDAVTHTIGTVRSAPDGSLFVSVGDGADFGGVEDDAFRSYDLQSMSGKVLHVDREGRGLPGHAFCPAETDLTRVCTKIWAAGFRNPFRFTLRQDGRLVLGDVGWNTYEELNVVEEGERHGWPCYEGRIHTPGYEDDPRCDAEYAKEGTTEAHAGPAYGYDRSGAGGAAVGGPTYPGGDYPDEFDGAVFYGDYAAGEVQSVALGGDEPVAQDFITDVFFTDLEIGPTGDLVYVHPGWGAGGGGVYRVTFEPAGRPTAVAGASPRFGSGLGPLSFSSAGSTDPEGGSARLEYEWLFGDGSGSSAANPTHTYSSPGAYTVSLTVTDSTGKRDTDTLLVHPGNPAPPANLDVAATPQQYRGGTTLTLTASATDSGAPLGPAHFDWNVVMRHDTHIHPVRTWFGTAQVGFRAAADHDADSHYEAILTATDAQGATTTETFPVSPAAGTLRLRSEPPGAELSYGGRLFTAPEDLTAAIGFETTVSAPPEFSSGGREWTFLSWSDGGARLHEFTVPPGGATLTASYRGATQGGGNPGGGDSGGGNPGGGDPGGAPSESADRTRPHVSLSAGRRVLRGTATDAGGIATVEVALAKRVGSRCRWWDHRKGKAPRASSCARPPWFRARLRRTSPNRWSWRATLRRALPRGSWLVHVRATDRAGNEVARLSCVPAAAGSRCRAAS